MFSRNTIQGLCILLVLALLAGQGLLVLICILLLLTAGLIVVSTTNAIGLGDYSAVQALIPEFASMRVDIRSTSTEEIDRLERTLRLALDQSMQVQSLELERGLHRSPANSLTAEIAVIGDRPSGELPTDARILSLSEGTLRQLIESDPDVAAHLLLNVSKMLCMRILNG